MKTLVCLDMVASVLSSIFMVIIHVAYEEKSTQPMEPKAKIQPFCNLIDTDIISKAHEMYVTFKGDSSVSARPLL